MPPRRTLPQELVDKFIDELGDAYRDPDHTKHSNHRITACQTLHACALVSKNWTDRSRAHLFGDVKIGMDKYGLVSLIPPQSLMPYIKKLRIQLRYRHYLVHPSPDLLIPFYTAPIAYLGIAGGIFDADTRACLAECITALSATLQTVAFKSCTLSLRIIIDILLAHSGLKHLHLYSCILKPATGGPLVPPRLSERPGASGRELGVFSRPLTGDHDLTVAAVAQLGSQFCRLNFDYNYGRGSIHATNALLKASAASLTSLTVHISASMFRPLRDQPPFSLEGCFNLSELALGMDYTTSRPVATSVSILSTINPIQRSRLEWVGLTTECVYQWLCKRSRDEFAQQWGELDAILSELAKVAMSREGKRLTFVLTSTGVHEKCIPFGRKWLPELLPRFHELGSLRVVDQGRGLRKIVADCDGSCYHVPDCAEEDYNGPSQG